MTANGKGSKKASSKSAQQLSAKSAMQVKGGVALSTVAIKQSVGDGSVKPSGLRGLQAPPDPDRIG